ncbi:MAG: undecaprenyldiphospho-muramoylpentapeptide beta-N-acetylglucosaminyltransferase [Oscillospiraceae bacterium]|nr:undecaprenyldiphospho-muramoylpentapeptide beta-N-acetylglucosaminyltransferase [Oscillospiraceae bacterium]
MKILFACGGTAGHINPALAVAGLVRERWPGASILFAGNPSGMEATLVPKAGYDFAPIEVLGFQRKLNLRNIRNNLAAAGYLLTATGKAKKIIREFAPDICMGTGGYVSGPVVRTAAKMKIPTLTHESNAFPGVTTRLLCKYVDKVLLGVPQAERYLQAEGKIATTGNPVREEILAAKREESRRKLGIGTDKICLLSFGGSLGAQRLNEAIADVVAWHEDRRDIYHIHGTGQYGVELFTQLLWERGVNPESSANLDWREYIDDMPACLAAADLVICRAGALSISELQAAGRASVLIPSPNVAGNHQYHNARPLAEKNAAILIEEKDLTGEGLVNIIADLAADPGELRNIGRNAAKMAITDAGRRILNEIEQLLT